MKTYTRLLGLGLAAITMTPASAQDEAAAAAEEVVTDDASVAEETSAAVEETLETTENAVDTTGTPTITTEEVALSIVEQPNEPECELHVFPTLEGQAQTTGWLSGFGIIGAVVDAAAHEDNNVSDAEYLREALGPRFQVTSFQTIDLASVLKLPEGTAVYYETPIADRDITTKVKTRLTESTHDCYAELIVTQNLYQKKAIYGRSLNNRFIYKNFRNGEKEANLVKGRGGNGLSLFPPKTPDGREAADADLRQAFLANFNEYAAKLQ